MFDVGTVKSSLPLYRQRNPHRNNLFHQHICSPLGYVHIRQQAKKLRFEADCNNPFAYCREIEKIYLGLRRRVNLHPNIRLVPWRRGKILQSLVISVNQSAAIVIT